MAARCVATTALRKSQRGAVEGCSVNVRALVHGSVLVICSICSDYASGQERSRAAACLF